MSRTLEARVEALEAAAREAGWGDFGWLDPPASDPAHLPVSPEPRWEGGNVYSAPNPLDPRKLGVWVTEEWHGTALGWRADLREQSAAPVSPEGQQDAQETLEHYAANIERGTTISFSLTPPETKAVLLAALRAAAPREETREQMARLAARYAEALEDIVYHGGVGAESIAREALIPSGAATPTETNDDRR